MTDNQPHSGVVATFRFGEDDSDHIVGDPECDACWGQPPLSPHDCETPGCLEHTSWGDENSDGDFWLYRMGDLCRER
jgi:hypothetical protein